MIPSRQLITIISLYLWTFNRSWFSYFSSAFMTWRQLTTAVEISRLVAKQPDNSHLVPNLYRIKKNIKVKKLPCKINQAHFERLNKSNILPKIKKRRSSLRKRYYINKIYECWCSTLLLDTMERSYFNFYSKKYWILETKNRKVFHKDWGYT